MSSFHVLQELLAKWPGEPIPETKFEDAVHERLRRALLGLRAGKTGPGDLAGLIRHVLAREGARAGSRERGPAFAVPRAEGWPDPTLWQAFGVEVFRQEPKRLGIRVIPWHPAWLGGSDPLSPALREEPRRRRDAVSADPAFSDLLDPAGTRYRTYDSPGQRQAVRAAFLMPAGSTLLVNLPTGGGKSLVFQSLALAAQSDGRMTLVIVPTVALARDQARRFSELTGLKGEWAYHARLASDAKRLFRQRIREGTQPIVFTSPESALGALRPALFEAASQSRLAHLVIDEAHLIAAWGADFRPEFQLVAGLRNGLRQESGGQLRTLLATATLSEDTWATLRQLFGQMEVISAVHLRPEPSHWIHRAADEVDRQAKLEEALRRVPRPFILYTTRREDAVLWADRLRAMGMWRVTCIRGGDLADEAGSRQLEAWAEREFDGVVATSAFGLGVDQSEVRTIVHACVPETVDRYYQEVGRAGRDGKAAISLLVYVDDDVCVAHGMADDLVIGVQKGLARWKAMWQGREPVPGREGTYMVPLDALAPHNANDSRLHRAWNRRTLILMARLGLITLDAVQPPALEPQPGESESEFEGRWRLESARFFEKSAVRLTESGHQLEQVWRERRAMAVANGDPLADMREILSGRNALSDIFRRAYTIRELGIYPDGADGDCPVTRGAGQVSHAYPPPPVFPPRHVIQLLEPNAWRGPPLSPLTLVSYRPPEGREGADKLRRALVDLLQVLVTRGFLEIATDEALRTRQEVRQLWKRSPARFVIDRAIHEEDGTPGEPRVARVSVVPPDGPRARLEHLFTLDRPVHVLVFPEDLPEPGGRGRKLTDLRPHTPLELFLNRLDQP